MKVCVLVKVLQMKPAEDCLYSMMNQHMYELFQNSLGYFCSMFLSIIIRTHPV